MRKTSKASLAILAYGSLAALVVAALALQREPIGTAGTPVHSHGARPRPVLAAGVQLSGGEPLAERDAVEEPRLQEPGPDGKAALPQEVDRAGISDAQRLKWLMRAHGMIALARESQPHEVAWKAELNFIRRSIGTILHAQGRAHFLDEHDRARGGFHLGPSEKGEFSFVQDCALYQFDRGEFPVHDLAFDREAGVLAAHASDIDDQLQMLLVQALDTIEAPRGGDKR